MTIPLTPIQRRFFEYPMVNRARFNQAYIVDLDAPLRTARAAIATTLAAYDVFALRYEPGPLGFRQVQCGALPLVQVLPTVDDLTNAATELHGSLDLRFGPIVAAAVAPVSSVTSVCVIVAHHLAVDLVSWQILMAHLDRRLRGAPTTVEPAAFAHWCQALHTYGTELVDDADWWGSLLASSTAAPRGGSTTGSGTYTRIAPVVRHGRIQLSECVLAALGVALCRQLGGPVTVDVEAHGREQIIQALPIMETVGWFTSPTPYLFTSRDLRAAYSEAMVGRQLPHGGLHFGLLRFGPQPVSPVLLTAPLPWVSFDFRAARHGPPQVGAARARSEPPLGRATDPRDRSWYQLSTVASVTSDGIALRATWLRSGFPDDCAIAIIDGWYDALRETTP